MALERVGEFGRAQWILAFVTSVSRNANVYFTHQFAYLVLQQRFLCLFPGRVNYDACSAEQICDAKKVVY